MRCIPLAKLKHRSEQLSQMRHQLKLRTEANKKMIREIRELKMLINHMRKIGRIGPTISQTPEYQRIMSTYSPLRLLEAA